MHRHTHKQNQPRKFTSTVFERDVFKQIILAAIIEVSPLWVLSLLPSINQKVLKVQLVLIKLLLHFKAHDVSIFRKYVCSQEGKAKLKPLASVAFLHKFTKPLT